MHTHFFKQMGYGALALATIGFGSLQAHAAEASPPDAAVAAPAGAATAPVARANPFGARPLAADALARSRGGTQVFNDMKLKGVVADNEASHVVTGSNLISDGALAGASGLPMVIQNSGNNVLIQNATIVNVQMK